MANKIINIGIPSKGRLRKDILKIFKKNKFNLFFLNILKISALNLPLLGMPMLIIFFIINNLNLKQPLLQVLVF